MADVGRPSDPKPTANGNESIFGKLMARLRVLAGSRGDTSVRESLEDVLEEHEPGEESLSKQERLMLLNILSFNELRVDDVMVPRADIIGVEESESLDEVVKTFCKAAHSRLPVYRDTLDDPIGMFHIKDVIQLLTLDSATTPETPKQLAALRRPVLFVPPSMPAIDLLIKMQTSHIHLALVIDEYGGTDGLVSIEDLVAEIVGDLEDNKDDTATPLILRRDDGGFDADARLDIEAFEKELGVGLVPGERSEDLDTLGGLVVSLVGRVPQRGEIIAHPSGLEFEVLDADPRRLKRLRVRGRVKPARDGDESGAGG